MIKDYIFLSLDNLKHRGIRSWLTMLGIFIGIAAVVALISLGNALQLAITGQFSSVGPDKLIVQNAETGFGPPGSTAVKKLTSHDLDLIKSVPGVEVAVPRFIRSVKIEFDKGVKFSYAADLPNDKQEAALVYETLNLKAESGKILEYADRGKVLLGHDFTKDTDFGKPVKVGDSITIQGRSFKVIGILEQSGSIIFNGVVILPRKDLKEILNIGDEIDTIAIKVTSKDIAEQVADNIAEKLRRDRKEKVGEEDFSVQTPIQALQSVNTILNIVNLIVAGIAAISLFVGGIGIANTMYTSVLERTKEIGTMKAVGARNKDILLIFLFESGFLGLSGGIIGAIIGLGFALTVSKITYIYYPSLGLDVMISWPLLILAISFSLFVGLISGILPAIQASRLKPVVALRK
jgi:putative ABC transport system permease protein